jgi:hypothetical protein
LRAANAGLRDAALCNPACFAQVQYETETLSTDIQTGVGVPTASGLDDSGGTSKSH